MNEVPWQISASLFVFYAKRYEQHARECSPLDANIAALNRMRSEIQYVRALQAMLTDQP